MAFARYFARYRVDQAVKDKLIDPIPNLASHSLRMGATSFVANDAPDLIIKAMGWLKS